MRIFLMFCWTRPKSTKTQDKFLKPDELWAWPFWMYASGISPAAERCFFVFLELWLPASCT